MTVVLACNPHAGHFRADRVARWQAALEAQGHRVTCLDSLAYARDPRAHEADMVGIVGGDGTARMVVEALRRAALSPLLAIMPAGTVNLIAREIEASGTKAKDGAKEGQARTHYHGLIDGQAFLCCASVGPDSAIVARVTPERKARWGKAAYVLAALAQIAHWPRPRLAVTVDGQPHEAEAVFVLKGTSMPGPGRSTRRPGSTGQTCACSCCPVRGAATSPGWRWARCWVQEGSGCRWKVRHGAGFRPTA
jgi:diacylglycerol kinase family enzyme